MGDATSLTVSVRDAWAEVLGIDSAAVPLDQGFFDAGGNSLLLLLLWERLVELTGADLAATDLFEHPTVLAQVRLLAGQPSRATTGETT
ncbi:acyl carrier protein [Actinoplanes sp. DH11]|uniref:acyl carrier protein n=1 Tax=Actinoplanes sp. DH11 TaxID=2857011 RepID=UPI001E2BD4E2|nr:acyl carrier protein [Actinoplanes sp. DH11]